jgi:hypothetical protein
MTSMIFYENAVPLNRASHQNLKLRPNPDYFTFASQTNSVLLAASEFPEALRDYPIVFVGQEGGPFAVVALVGFSDKENLMVDASGRWEANTYVPAFIRRYPFILATGANDDPDNMTVCIDEACKGLGTEEGEALFGANGVETEYMKGVVGFLQLFHAEMKRTGEFAARLAALGLLTSKVVNVQSNGETKTLGGFFLVDQEKLDALTDAQMLALARSGDLAFIHAHLLSLANVSRLAARLDERLQAAAGTAPA